MPKLCHKHPEWGLLQMQVGWQLFQESYSHCWVFRCPSEEAALSEAVLKHWQICPSAFGKLSVTGSTVLA